jgi:BolA protein
MKASRPERIRSRLQQAFGPVHISVCDDSALHEGHAGARDGAGHFSVTIESESFRSKSLLARHRLVYEAVADLMGSEIHALSIDAFAPGER